MKWHIIRLIAALVLALQFQVYDLMENPATALASNTCQVTVTLTIEWGGIFPPSNFRVTRINDTKVLIEWTPAEGANTTIRMKVNELPDGFTDGYVVYSGNASSFYDEWVDLDTMWSKVYYIAYSEVGDELRSESYVWDYAESPYVAEVAENLSWFGNLSTAVAALVTILPLVLISVLAFWKENFILFIIAFGLAFMAGLNAPDMLSGDYVTTSTGIAIGLLLIAYAFFCAAMSFRLMFWEGD